MAITRTSIADALDANLGEMYQDGLTSWPEEYSKTFNVLNSTKQSEKDSYESGFVTMPEKSEGSAATYDTILPGISKTYTHKTYALGYEITEEAIEDNLRTPETFNKLPQALSRSAIETVEVTAANIFNTVTDTGYDGKVLFAEDHPLLGGGTESNRPSTMADLSVTSLTAGITAVEKYVDEKGLKRPTKANTLLIPIDLWNTAEELLKSSQKPYVANNEINALQQQDLRYSINHYLTDKFCVRYVSNNIEKIALNCGKLLRDLTTQVVTMLSIGQSAANQLRLAVQRLHGQPQVSWVMI